MTDTRNPPALDEPAAGWFRRGGFEALAGIDVFVVDTGPASETRATLWLHGFPSSSLDWRAVVDALDAPGRMLLPDLPGFGFSAKPAGYSYSLVDQADRIALLLARRGISSIRLIAHDMGTSVACELLARRELGLLPFAIESLVLTNGSVFIEQARLTPSQKLLRSPAARLYARLASARLFRWQLGRILAAPVPEAELDAMWVLMNLGDGTRRLPDTIGYIAERYRFHRRWTAPLARLDIPVAIVWGRLDPVAVAAIAQRLAATIPRARLDWLDEIGHFPMLEAPERFAAILRKSPGFF